MNTTCKRLLVPGAFASLAAMALISAGQDQGNGPNALPGGTIAPASASVPGTLAGGAAHKLVGISWTGGASRDGYLVDVPAFSAALVGGLGVGGSGLDRQPGTRNYYVTGGMSDGGNLYIVTNSTGATAMIGATGWPSVPGLGFSANGRLYGSAQVSTIGDGLVDIDFAGSGAGTLVGAGYGGPGGIDAIAEHPGGIMYGNTGFFYDGLPGDVITIDTGSGLGTDTGIDMTPIPASVVAGLTFASDGQGWASIGAINGSLYEYDTTGHTITLLGVVGFNSCNDIAVAR